MEGWILFIVGISFCGASATPVDSDEKSALQCGELEVYTSCIQGGCAARNCSQLGEPVPCIRLDPRFCRPGCVCQEEYLRDGSGGCVKKDQCREAIQCNQDEVFSHCVNGGCDARNCSQLGRPVPCVKMNPKYCIKGCVCQPGYLRGNEGCVKEELCHKELCTGPHEYFSCGGACDNVCATLHEQSQQNCPIRNIKCNEMCYCEEGYARDAGGVCVPIQQCAS